MRDDPKLENNEEGSGRVDGGSLVSRRNFLVGLKKWSAIVIGGIALGGVLPAQKARAGWVNGGGSWVNGRGGWVNGGGSWINRSGGWINGGGGGGSWVNNRGGGGWINKRY